MKRYSFDTSAFIEPWQRHYPPDIAASLWERLDSLGKSGVIVAQAEVFQEVKKKHDGLSEWLRERQHFFQETTVAVQGHVREILKSHSRLLALAKNRSGADVWVVGLARSIGGTVVTYENWDPKRKNIKIPEVCSDLGIQCIDFVGFLRETGIKLEVAAN